MRPAGRGTVPGMGAVKPIERVSEEEYLAGERTAKHKHEYVAGRVYMMAGARNEHNAIATAILVSLGGRLRGRPCQPFNSDTKVRVRLPTGTRFYYPDAMVVCDPNPPGDVFQDRPVVIVEVISAATRRTDEGEKREAYEAIPTLAAYLLVESASPRVVACARTGDGTFAAHAYDGLDAVVPLPAIGAALPLAEVYERVTFAAGEDEAAEPTE